MTTSGRVVWLTGLPASGKTSIARRLIPRLQTRGCATLWLDSDALRSVMTPSPSYSDEERDRVYATLGRIATWAAEGGVSVVVSATAPRRRYRDAVRTAVSRFIEVYVSCDDAERRRRDPKRLYRLADAGMIDRLPGVGAPYETPERPEVVVDSTRHDPDVLADQVIATLDASDLMPDAHAN